MIKVIFTNGKEAYFHGTEFQYNATRKMFIIPNIAHATVIIPAASVKCIGIWDKEEGEFYQRGYGRPPGVREGFRHALESLTDNE